MANRPGLTVSDEEYAKRMDAVVEGHRNLPPDLVPAFQGFLERFENFMEKRGTPIPKHSHRFKPEALWPDAEPMHNYHELTNKGDELVKKQRSTTKSGDESTTSQKPARRVGVTEQLLIDNGIPVTRKNWIDLAYMGKPPKEWTYEHEMELPKRLRDTSRWDF